MWHDENGFFVKQRQKNVPVTRTGTLSERDRMRMNTNINKCANYVRDESKEEEEKREGTNQKPELFRLKRDCVW